jgi:hypothetical protein
MAPSLAARLARIDWPQIGQRLDADGWARLGPLLGAAQCAALQRDFDRDRLFRSSVDMERHRFGRGVYRYFAAPLPPLIETLRGELYARLAPLANAWASALGEPAYPTALPAFLARCRAAGQTRPTPLLLRYQAGDYNCLHQDRYGAVAFPLQVVIPLSTPGRDFSGGELLFVEQRPRSQSRGSAVVPGAGEGVVFANATRPVHGARGVYRAQLRHGLSVVASGRRVALGIIFHDAA